MDVDPRRLREANRELLAFYDSPEYRQLFAGYRAPSVEAAYSARQAAADGYRRWDAHAAPDGDDWELLNVHRAPDEQILSDVARRTVEAQAALADEYRARLGG